MKTYQLNAIDELGNVELVTTCVSPNVAEEILFKLKEGDDKHAPCVYIIEEVDA